MSTALEIVKARVGLERIPPTRECFERIKMLCARYRCFIDHSMDHTPNRFKSVSVVAKEEHYSVFNKLSKDHPEQYAEFVKGINSLFDWNGENDLSSDEFAASLYWRILPSAYPGIYLHFEDSAGVFVERPGQRNAGDDSVPRIAISRDAESAWYARGLAKTMSDVVQFQSSNTSALIFDDGRFESFLAEIKAALRDLRAKVVDD